MNQNEYAASYHLLKLSRLSLPPSAEGRARRHSLVTQNAVEDSGNAPAAFRAAPPPLPSARARRRRGHRTTARRRGAPRRATPPRFAACARARRFGTRGGARRGELDADARARLRHGARRAAIAHVALRSAPRARVRGARGLPAAQHARRGARRGGVPRTTDKRRQTSTSCGRRRGVRRPAPASRSSKYVMAVSMVSTLTLRCSRSQTCRRPRSCRGSAARRTYLSRTL